MQDKMKANDARSVSEETKQVKERVGLGGDGSEKYSGEWRRWSGGRKW